MKKKYFPFTGIFFMLFLVSASPEVWNYMAEFFQDTKNVKVAFHKISLQKYVKILCKYSGYFLPFIEWEKINYVLTHYSDSQHYNEWGAWLLASSASLTVTGSQPVLSGEHAPLWDKVGGGEGWFKIKSSTSCPSCVPILITEAQRPRGPVLYLSMSEFLLW